MVGAAILCAVVAALAREGAIVGRYGGDEFVVVLPGADREAAHRYASEVLSSLGDDTVVVPEKGTRVPVSITIGLATYPDDAESTDGLIKAADDAMYEARRSCSGVRAGTVRRAA